MKCLFCSIAHKEIPSRAVYEDEAVFAFLDIHPRAPGHTIVIPKTHVETILNLPLGATGSLFQGVQKVMNLVEKAIQPDGFTVGANQGRGGRVEVDHLHIHIIPRFLTDNGKDIQSIVMNPPEQSLDEIAKKIINA